MEPNFIWYTYLSWWVFIWFILFKLRVIKYSPFWIYIIIITFIIAKTTDSLTQFKLADFKNKNIDSVLIILIITILVDIVPIFYLKPIINLESIIFGLIVICLYLVMMYILKINPINHYNKVDLKKIMKYFDSKTLLRKMIIKD